MRAALRLALLGAVLFAAPGAASAQSTGGSFGGGSFGGGGGGGGGGGSSSWGGSSNWGSNDWSSWGTESGDHGIFDDIRLVLIIAFLGLTLAGWVAQVRWTAPNKVDVSVLRLGLDATARKHLQEELARISRASSAYTTEGMVATLRETALALRRARDSWVYAGVVNSQPAEPGEADILFRAQAQRARDGFQHDGAAGPDGGPGLAVITIVVAARTSIIDFHDPANAEEVRRWLEAISQLTTANLTAVDVIWTPAAAEDRMSAAELERFNPEMKRIRGDTVVGKLDCAHCGGRFPAELLSCPHCGARVREAA